MRPQFPRSRPADRWLRALAGAAALAAVLAATSAANAVDLGDARLDVVRSEQAMSCPDTDQLAAAIERIGQRPAVPPSTTPLVLEVRVDRNTEGFTAEIRAFGRKSGLRQLAVPGANCDGLGSALAITLALLMDRQLESEPPPAPPPAAPQVEPAPAPKPALPPKSPTSFALSLGESVTLGVPRGLSAMAELDANAHSGAWLASLGGFWTPTRSYDLDQGWIDVQLLGGRGRLCRSLLGQWEQLHAGACIDLAIGRLRGEGHGYPTTRAQNRPWFALGGSARAGGAISGPAFWRTELAMLVPTQQEAFSVDLVGTGFESDRLSWVLGAQVGLVLF